MPPPETITLRPSRLKWAGIFLLCLLFAVVGVQIIADGSRVGWVVVVFFGLGCLVVAVSMIPNATYLRLTPSDFTICSLFRARSYRWQDVTGFTVGRAGSRRMVMFDFAPNFHRRSRSGSWNAKLVGHEAGLPDNYGLDYEELADLMNRHRARWDDA